MNKIMDKNKLYKRAYILIMELGSMLTEYNHEWANKQRKEFEDVTSYLSSY